MAKRLSTEDLVLNIIVNSNKAQSEIGKLSRTLQDNKSKLEAAQDEMKRLEKSNSTSSNRYKQLQQDVVKYNAVISDSKKRLTELNQSLSLEDKSLKQLKDTLRQTTSLWNQATSAEDRKNYADQIHVLNNRIAELKTGTEQTGNSLVKMTNRLNQHIGAVVAGGASLIVFWTAAKKGVQQYAEFDDVLADVMKTTNLNKQAVNELNSELEVLQTRTSQEDLLGLARIAGKLGYTEIAEITEFVKANNQIIVSLNEDLGGDVEETVNKIGKLVDIFKLKDLYSTEEAFLKVGSALNELGMASTANEGYMVEFARRMAGVAPLAKISIEQIFGLGAALDQLGQTEEVSSTALSKLFLNIAKDAKTYSKYAGMEVTAFKNLLEKDFMSAFVKVLEGVKDNSEGINELAETLGDLGEDGGRVIGVIGSLANNVNKITGSISLANQAMKEGSSITDEYNIKNETAAAKLDMAQKEVTRLWIELGERLWPVMTSGLNIFSLFISLLSKTVGFIANNIKVITTLAFAFTAYWTAVQISAKWELITTTYMAAKRIAAMSLNVVYGLLTGSITRTAAAQQLLNIRMLANPYGIAATAIVGLISYLVLFKKETDSAANAQTNLSKAMSEANAEGERESANIQWNLKKLNDENLSRENKLQAINNLRDIMPEVLKDYKDEEILAGKANKAIIAQANAIILRAKARAIEGLIQEEERKRIEADQKLAKGWDSLSIMDKLGYGWESLLSGKAFSGKSGMSEFLEDINNSYNSINTAQKIYNSELEKTLNLIDQNAINPFEESVVSAGKVVTTEDKDAESKRNKAFRKELDDAEKHYQDLLQKAGLFREDLSELTVGQLNKLSAFEDGYQTKIDGIHNKYGESLKNISKTADKELKRRAAAESNYIDSLLIKRKSETEAEKSAYNERLQKAGLFGVEKENLTERQLLALEVLEKEHKSNINKIDADAISKSFDQQKSDFQNQISDLRIRNHEELSEIRTLAQAKEVLSAVMSQQQLSQVKNLGQARKLIQNQQQLEEERLTKEHLQSLLEILTIAQETGQFEGVNLSDSILSEEERKVLEDRIRAIKQELASLTGRDKTEEVPSNSDRNRVDILGMSVQDWENLFKNIGTGEGKLKGMLSVLDAGTQLWGQYNKLVANKEDAQLQKDEASNNKKKDNLKKRLDAGAISQEEYNKQVEKLDKDLDKKKAKVARDQAVRERNVALTSAIVNTAKGITAAFPNLVLMALVAAMGGLQIATIANTPLPVIPGAESGGQFLEVTRAQDGKRFNAKNDPAKRGYVSNPTVLVGENGTEWVANADAVSNPTVKPILDVLDQAQKNGSINTLNLSNILAGSRNQSMVTGRQSGGFIADQSQPAVISTTDPQLIKVLNKLDSKLENLKAEISILGKGGLQEKMTELNNIQNNSTL